MDPGVWVQCSLDWSARSRFATDFLSRLWRCRRRTPAVFYVFDLLSLDGQDLRARSLIERKQLLRSIIPEQLSALLYASSQYEGRRELFEKKRAAGV